MRVELAPASGPNAAQPELLVLAEESQIAVRPKGVVHSS